MAKEWKAYLEERLAAATPDDPELGFYRRAHTEVKYHLQRTEPEPPDRLLRVLLVTRRKDVMRPRPMPESQVQNVPGADVKVLDGDQVHSDDVLRLLAAAKGRGRPYDLVVTGESYGIRTFGSSEGSGGYHVLNEAHDKGLARSVVMMGDFLEGRPGIPRKDWDRRGVSDWIWPKETEELADVISQRVLALRPQPAAPQHTA